MDRKTVIRTLYSLAPGIPMVFTTGHTCRDAYAIDDRDSNFYMVGSMGLAASIATGIACSIPSRPVMVIDGDGSLLMNPSNILLVGKLKIRNLIHIVLDNNAYESTGGQQTISDGIDFAGIARLTGYESCNCIENTEQLYRGVSLFLNETNGPAFFHVNTQMDAHVSLRIGIPLADMKSRFSAYLIRYAQEERATRPIWGINNKKLRTKMEDVIAVS